MLVFVRGFVLTYVRKIVTDVIKLWPKFNVEKVLVILFLGEQVKTTYQ